jgi:hypothetical protein
VGEVIISVTLPTDEKTQRVFHELSTWEAFAHRAFLDLLDSYLDAPSRGTAPCVPAEHSLDIPCSLLVRILGFALAAVQLAFFQFAPTWQGKHLTSNVPKFSQLGYKVGIGADLNQIYSKGRCI